jgi:hypothetical protein
MSGIYLVTIVGKALRGIKPTILYSFFLGYAPYRVSAIRADTTEIMFLVMASSYYLLVTPGRAPPVYRRGSRGLSER